MKSPVLVVVTVCFRLMMRLIGGAGMLSAYENFQRLIDDAKKAGDPAERQSLLDEAVERFKVEYAIAEGATTPADRAFVHVETLIETVRAALSLRALDTVRTTAEELLGIARDMRDDDFGGSRYRYGYYLARQALGHVAMSEQRLSVATEELERSLDPPAEGGVLRSFGPSMVLAGEILAAGGRDAVARYLVRAAELTSRRRHLRWAAEIRNGQQPDLSSPGDLDTGWYLI